MRKYFYIIAKYQEFIIFKRHRQNKKAKTTNDYALEPGKIFLYKTCFSF